MRPLVRVRFAPSPTGHIHLGGLRTALYNYIFARKHKGQFVLRIEDTDRSRVVPGSADEIENVLEWAGLKLDESPRLGGPFKPYVQSKRLQTYIDRAHELIDNGKAYMCFCSPERLELLKKYQLRNRDKPHYDGKCRHLTAAEIKEKLDESKNKYVIRFSLPSGDTVFEDLVFGNIRNNLVASKEGDPIILKSDRYPTYHFANVVDDKFMNITNVIRGAEWIPSTAKHIQIYHAFGWQPPQYLHFPLITMEDGSKMSKRSNNSHVTEWIRAGYRPTALLNFLTSTGGGVPKEKQDHMHLWTLDEFVESFDFSQITCHPGSLDLNRLQIYSSKELQKAWSDDPEKLMSEVYHMLDRSQLHTDIDHDLAKTIVAFLIGRITSLNELLSHEYAFIWKHPKLSWSKSYYLNHNWNLEAIINDVIALIKTNGIEEKESFIRNLKNLTGKHRIEYSEFMKFLRKILTGSDRGLPIYEIAQCLGAPRLISYLERGSEYVRSIN